MFSRLAVEALQVTVGGSILATCIAIDGTMRLLKRNDLTSHENPGQAVAYSEESPPGKGEQEMGCQNAHETQHKGKEREVIPEKANAIAPDSVNACTDNEMAEATSETPKDDNCTGCKIYRKRSRQLSNRVLRYKGEMLCLDCRRKRIQKETLLDTEDEDNTKTITRVDAMDMYALSSHAFAKMQCLEVSGPTNAKRSTRKKLYLWNDVHQKALLHHGGEVGIEFTLNTKRISKGEMNNQKQC